MDLTGCGEIGQLQDGLIARHQALKFLSENQVERLVERRILEPLHAAVYAFPGSPRTWRQRARAATLIREDYVVAAYRTAAYLWGLVEHEPPLIEILVPVGRSNRVPGVTVHRTRIWVVTSFTVLDGIPLTTPARTIVDLADRLPRYLLRRAVDYALTRNLCSLDDIAAELSIVGSRRRKRCGPLFDILALRDDSFSKSREVSETEPREWIRAAGLPDPTPEHPVIVSKNETRFIDLAYPDRKIAIELVSWKWHGGPSAFEDDICRKAQLRKLGWTILEFSRKTPREELIAGVRSALSNP